MFWIHFSQLLPQKRPKRTTKVLQLSSEAVESFVLSVEGDAVLEVAIAQFWKADQPTTLSLELRFGGIVASSKRVSLMGSDSVYPLMARNTSRT
jgi:hypothetical protein